MRSTIKLDGIEPKTRARMRAFLQKRQRKLSKCPRRFPSYLPGVTIEQYVRAYLQLNSLKP